MTADAQVSRERLRSWQPGLTLLNGRVALLGQKLAELHRRVDLLLNHV